MLFVPGYLPVIQGRFKPLLFYNCRVIFLQEKSIKIRISNNLNDYHPINTMRASMLDSGSTLIVSLTPNSKLSRP